MDVVVFSITFETFWSLVLEYRYDKLLQELLRNSHNTMMLRQASTSQVVDSIGSNLVSSKGTHGSHPLFLYYGMPLTIRPF
jgi:hypothetical protein